MMGISLAAGATLVWFASLPVDQLPHHPRINPTGALAAAAQSSQERFEHARNAEIDASIAAVAAQRAQERFEHARNAEIDASIAAVAVQRAQERFEQKRNAAIDASISAITLPWRFSLADMQTGSFARVDAPEQPWQP